MPQTSKASVENLNLIKNNLVKSDISSKKLEPLNRTQRPTMPNSGKMSENKEEKLK